MFYVKLCENLVQPRLPLPLPIQIACMAMAGSRFPKRQILSWMFFKLNENNNGAENGRGSSSNWTLYERKQLWIVQQTSINTSCINRNCRFIYSLGSISLFKLEWKLQSSKWKWARRVCVRWNDGKTDVAKNDSMWFSIIIIGFRMMWSQKDCCVRCCLFFRNIISVVAVQCCDIIHVSIDHMFSVKLFTLLLLQRNLITKEINQRNILNKPSTISTISYILAHWLTPHKMAIRQHK